MPRPGTGRPSKGIGLAYSLLTWSRCLPWLQSMRVMTSARRICARGKREASGGACRAGLLVAAIVCVTGCYLSPINRAPMVLSINPAGPLQRGEKIQFTATVTDPDGDAVDLSWGVKSGECKPKDDPTNWPTRMAASTYTVPGEMTSDTFCVWAFATDRYGAVGVGNDVFLAGDRPPVATIDLVSPKLMAMYYLGTTFQLQGHDMDPDGDQATQYDWTLRLPSGTTQPLDPCGGAAGVASPRCFQATGSGRYVVSLTVSAHGLSGTSAPLQLDVHDHIPPCIQDWTHKSATVSLDPQMDQEFTVLAVLDDGRADAPDINYTWFMTPPGALPGSAPVAQDVSFSRLKIDKKSFKFGDTAVIRVEVRDDRPDVVDDILRRCGDAPTCSTTDPITNSECFQRISWNVTWNG